jgi:hypothetical protein
VWHHPTAQKVKGIARNLATTQSQCLRVVSGAYRATLVRFLEVETATPPPDLYLNKWVADFEQRLERTGKGALIRGICNRVAVRLQQRRQAQRQRQHVAAETPAQRPSLEFGEGRTRWATEWAEGQDPEEILWVHWKRRWMQHPGEPPDPRLSCLSLVVRSYLGTRSFLYPQMAQADVSSSDYAVCGRESSQQVTRALIKTIQYKQY